MLNRQSWKSMSGQQLSRLVITASAIAISYEGISQGVMGSVTVAPEFGRRMGYTNDQNKVVKPTLQGGIAAMYYAYVSLSVRERKLANNVAVALFSRHFGLAAFLITMVVSRACGWPAFGAWLASSCKLLRSISLICFAHDLLLVWV